MTTTIRRDPNNRPARVAMRRVLRALGLLALLAFVIVLVLAWQRGGPRPVREIAVPLPAPASA